MRRLFNPGGVGLKLNGHVLYRNGAPETRGALLLNELYYQYGFVENNASNGRSADRMAAGAACPEAFRGFAAAAHSFATGERDPLGFWADRNSRPGVERKEVAAAAHLDTHTAIADIEHTGGGISDIHANLEALEALGQLRGKALALTFLFTRCPNPDYCPRLSKNFQEAAEKLRATPGAPTNWHFLSVTFDTEYDTPAVLKAYAQRYNYDPAHWSFLTGAPDKIAELARLNDVNFDRDGGFYNHNFRTLIIDPAGALQTIFPMTGDISADIANEILKALRPFNQ